MAEACKVTVGAGVNQAGDAAVVIDLGPAAVVLDIYEAMRLADVLAAKIGESICWHKLHHDKDAPSVLRMVVQGSA